MSREIKFRGWDGDAMHEIYAMHKNGIGALGNGGMIISGRNDHSIMQYTGIKDKNGVEIYEGDIVDCEDFLDYSYLMIVKFDGRGRFIAVEKSNDNDFLYLDDLDFFVTGNIHQNPELLK